MKFFKRYKFYINKVGEEPIPYQEVIRPAIQGPKWFEGLCPFVDKKKRAIDLHPKPIVRTARSCPGMLELFKNSFLVTFPCDLILETHKTGKYSWQKPSATRVLDIVHHPEEQVEFSSPLSSFIMIKFCLPFMYQAPNNKVSLAEASYWKIQPYRIAPGILNFTDTRDAMPLNVITFFEKKNKVYEFKKGEPMALFYTLHKSTLEMNEKLQDSLARQRLERTFTNKW